MLKRKITQQLVEWMNRKDRKSLILEGARQVGKTYSVREFANTYYKDRCIEINSSYNQNTKQYSAMISLWMHYL